MLKCCHLFAGVLLILLFNSCYKEQIIFSDPQNGTFNFIMPDSLENKILTSRGIRFYFDPLPTMEYDGKTYELDKMKVRGQTTTNFQRKGFAINIKGRITIGKENEIRNFEKIKLISLVWDYTYIENQLAHKLLNEVGLWPLKSFFTQVKLNNHHQGLYLFIEDPEDYLFDFKNAEIVIRRYYRNGISQVDLNSNLITKESDYYIDLYKSFYQTILDYSGKELYDELSSQLNLQNYMRKMAVDFILMNGDYTDELMLYAIDNNGETYFDILPWDYDDIFASTPHEVGRDWSVGKAYGNRYYESYSSLKEEIGDKLIFSIEDDIDYTIAMDEYLYQKYLNELQFVVSKISVTKLEEIFENIHNELEPFYQIKEVVEQSKFDNERTNWKLFEANIKDKKTLLIDRVIWINKELLKQN